jgi:hypothetical protein
VFKDLQDAGARGPSSERRLFAECRTESVNLVDTIWDRKQLSSLKDMTGHRFGRLSVIRRAGTSADGIATWLCRCDCGNRSIGLGSNLRHGRTKSCGCYGRQIGTMNTRHGHSKHYRKSPEYSAWSSMLARCYRPTNDAFPWYGGAGITACKRWRGGFSCFLADVGLRPATNFILVRKYKDRNYTPSNCEWGIKTKRAPRRVGRRQTRQDSGADRRRIPMRRRLIRAKQRACLRSSTCRASSTAT